jgi:hypothetical protein
VLLGAGQAALQAGGMAAGFLRLGLLACDALAVEA